MLHLSKVETLPNVLTHYASLWCNLQINYLSWNLLFHFWNMTFTWSTLVSTSSIPFIEYFQKLLFVLPAASKCQIFSHLSGLHLLSNADSAKNNLMVNATFIESRNTTECIDALRESLVQSAKKLFEVKAFVPFFEQWSKPVSESTFLRESFAVWMHYWNHSQQVYKSRYIQWEQAQGIE